jgi:hypothetical protein
MMSRVMLLMDRHPSFRDRTMRMLAGAPDVFQHMLDVHLGEMAMAPFLLSHGAEIGLRLALSSPVRI